MKLFDRLGTGLWTIIRVSIPLGAYIALVVFFPAAALVVGGLLLLVVMSYWLSHSDDYPQE